MKGMRYSLMAALPALCLAFSVATASANVVGAHVLGALQDNPALLGFAPGFTMTVDSGMALPGVAGAQTLIDKWYDESTHELSIRLDFSSEEKAQETMATIDKALQTFSGMEARGAAGLSFGRLGLGATASGKTNLVNKSKFISDADNEAGFDVNLDITVNAMERADGIIAIGVPLSGGLAIGGAVKRSTFLVDNAVVNATMDQLQKDAGAANPQGKHEVANGILFDAGVALNGKNLQADLALKDIGNVEWKAEKAPWDQNVPVGPVSQHDKLTHLAGGVVYKPFEFLDLSARFDRNLYGENVYRTEAALRPARWLTLKAGQVSANGDKYLTLGGSMRLLILGFDAGISAKDGTIMGGQARFSIGF